MTQEKEEGVSNTVYFQIVPLEQEIYLKLNTKPFTLKSTRSLTLTSVVFKTFVLYFLFWLHSYEEVMRAKRAQRLRTH